LAETDESNEEETKQVTNKNEELTSSKRETWGNKIEFLLASVGLAVGLGNVWRFPYLCQKNGGGAFLIPYFVMMVIEGLPLLLLELAVGQRQRTSGVGVWVNLHPALKGIGISAMMVSMFLCLYYIVVIAWCFQYIFASFSTILPWSPKKCNRYGEYKLLQDRCSMNSSYYQTDCEKVNNFTDCCVKDAPLHYFYRTTLDISPSLSTVGDGLNWKLFGCFILSWLLVYVCIVRGIKSSGKVVYFTATAPYVILFILLCFALTLEGADKGLQALFQPDFSKLSDPNIWLDAASQMFFTLSLGFGALLSFASYLPVKNDCIRDGYAIVLINCATSLFAAVVVFAIIGHRSHVTGESITQVGNGPGLVFITFCDAFLNIPVPQLWSILFFCMLILLGIDSEFGILEGFIAPFYDMGWIKLRKEIFTGGVIIIFAMAGMGMVTSSGYYAFQLFDDYSLSIGLLFIGLFQTIAVSWVYGNDRFADDIEFMTGKRPSIVWLVCWKYISPFALIVIIISSTYKLLSNTQFYNLYVGCANQKVDFSPLSKGVTDSLIKHPYPTWALIIIAIFILLPIVSIVGWMIKDFIENTNKWKSGIKNRISSWAFLLPDPSTSSKNITPYEDLEKETPKQDEEEIF